MASYSDDFNAYSDGPLANNAAWENTIGGGLEVFSNQVAEDPGSGFQASSVAAATASFGNDGEAEVEIATFSNFDFCGIGYRTSTNNGYYAYAGDGEYVLVSVTGASTETEIGTNATSPASGHVLKILCSGTTISVELDTGGGFTEIISVTDSDHSSGQPGMYYNRQNANASRLDNFSAADSAGSGPTLDSVGTSDTVVLGDVEPITYSNFTSGIELANINNASTGLTNLTVSNVTGTTADVQLLDFDSWVDTKSCPFSSTNQTSQQVTVNNTDEAEEASRSVTFNPPTGYTVTETNNMTWPAPDGSILKGFASQPPNNSQVIAPPGLNIDSFGIVTTDLTSNQTCYFFNATTEEGSSFLWIIESGADGTLLFSVESIATDIVQDIVQNIGEDNDRDINRS